MLHGQIAARSGNCTSRGSKANCATKNEWLDSARTEHQFGRIARRANSELEARNNWGDWPERQKSQRSVQEFRNLQKELETEQVRRAQRWMRTSRGRAA